jgi:hypothetical protein
MQDRGKVCTKHTIGLEIVLEHPMMLHGDEFQLEARFSSFGDSANLDSRLVHGLRQRNIGSEIILDTPDGTPW